MSTPQGPFIPFFRPTIGDAEIEAVVATLRSGWLTTGTRAAEFERAFADYVGAQHAVAVSSCTAALHLALAALGVGPGDDVIVPTLTFAATAEAAIHLGARPVLVDVEPTTLNIDPDAFAKATTARTRALIPVHFGGLPCDMDRLLEIARDRDIAVIEDAAHCLPGHDRGRFIGTIGTATCFSFYATKTITTGEGGMITTDDPELAASMRMLSLHGLSDGAWDRFTDEGSAHYEITAAGYKYNLSDVAASLGIQQLSRVEEFWEARHRQSLRYDESFSDVEEIEFLPPVDDSRHAHHLYVILLRLDRLTIDRDQFVKLLRHTGVGTSIHYKPLHMHKLYRDKYSYGPRDLPVATDIYHRTISLPIYPNLTAEEQQRVIEAVSSITSAHRQR